MNINWFRSFNQPQTMDLFNFTSHPFYILMFLLALFQSVWTFATAFSQKYEKLSQDLLRKLFDQIIPSCPKSCMPEFKKLYLKTGA